MMAMVGLLQDPVGTELYKRLKLEGRLLGEYSGNNVIDDTNIVTCMDRETLRSNYRALVKSLYGPKNYYDRVKIFLAEYKEPKEKPPLTADAVLAVARCFFWLGLVRKGRKDFWRVFCWLCLHKHESLQSFLGLAILGYHFRKVHEDLPKRSHPEPNSGGRVSSETQPAQPVEQGRLSGDPRPGALPPPPAGRLLIPSPLPACNGCLQDVSAPAGNPSGRAAGGMPPVRSGVGGRVAKENFGQALQYFDLCRAAARRQAALFQTART